MSKRLPSLTPDDVIRALKRGGFYLHHATGSHHAIRHPTDPTIRVTVARHRRELKRGTLHSIVRQAGLTVDEFLDLL